MYQDFVDIFHTQKKDDLLNLYMDLESLFRIERTIDPHLRVIDFDLLFCHPVSLRCSATLATVDVAKGQ